MALIDDLIREGWLKTPRIIEAFRTIKRVDFMPADIKNLAELNEALPIGHGQTISQPLTVAFMLELLQPEPGNKILDVGSGSGWTTALLAYIVSQEKNPKSRTRALNKLSARPSTNAISTLVQNLKSNGKVIAIEVIPELKAFGEKNVARYNFIKEGMAEFLCTDGSKGYPKEAPYDRILASASGSKLPEEWKGQLKVGGRIVMPIGSSIWLFVKKAPSSAKATRGRAEEFEETEYPGFAFVPLVEG